MLAPLVRAYLDGRMKPAMLDDLQFDRIDRMESIQLKFKQVL